MAQKDDAEGWRIQERSQKRHPFAPSCCAILCAFLLVVSPLSAQIDPTGHWRTLETRHFRIHARAEHRALAVRAAGEAELAYAALAAVLPAPKGVIDLVVADNTDAPNGYATTYPSNRVVVYAVPPAGDIELLRYDRWLRLVITHELAHIFHLDLARGWWGVGRSLLGRAPFLFPNEYSPPWLREGVAVFYESRLTDAGRLGGAYHRAIVAAEGIEGRGLPVDEANTPTPKWPAGLRAYAFGGEFLEAAAREHGDSLLARYITRTATRAVPYFALSGAWGAEAGHSLGEAWGRWQRGEEQRAFHERIRIDHVLVTATHRPLAAPPGQLRLELAPRLSPDGSKLLLAFNDGRDATRLLVLDRATGERRTVGAFAGVNGVAWTPDGNAVVSQLDYVDRYNIRSDLRRVSLSGPSGVRRTTHDARLKELDVAPDGAIVATRVVPGGTELVLIDSSGTRVIGPALPYTDWAQPRFDSSGTQIAAVRVIGGWHNIVLGDRDGAWRAVTNDTTPDIQPAFSPDGRWLAWSREVRGVSQIVGVPLDNGVPGPAVQLAREEYGGYAPAPAADGLLYLAYHGDGFRLTSAPYLPQPLEMPSTEMAHRAMSTPAVDTTRERDYSAWQTLLPRYWLPQVYAQSGGAWLGVFTSGRDVLERHAYTATVMYGTGVLAGQWQGAVGYVHAGPGKATFDAYASHSPDLVDTSATTAAPLACCAPSDEASAGLTFVRRTWRTTWALRTGLEYANGSYERVGGSIALTFASPVSGAMSISAQDGVRLQGSIRYRRRTSSDSSSVEYVGRAAFYKSLKTGQFARQVLALRVSGGASSGSDRPDFNVGGASGGALDILPGVALGGASRPFQVRGYEPGYLSGQQAVGASLEDRIPLAVVSRGLGFVPVGLDRLSGAVFVDAGAAWSTDYCGDVTPGYEIFKCGSAIASFGAELAADLGLGYTFPLRVRLGGALRAGQGGAGAYFAFGSAF